ncbi:alkaline phosphatase family protein [Roseibium sp. RKSG952]|uniref:alkaline phosphatase family protein n=1 Tax=Roseibium sp. RKSG952 TaxID=2529384 RepID=UPI0012BCDB37|nr:alkaline phosphatase family protein [Roseibium sp. RKSG952]MTH96859.1 alkaline phosphatase family protein [Roseibium sp. RKSG952]
MPQTQTDSTFKTGQPELPPVLAGPILRKVTPDRVVIWLASRSAAKVRLELFPDHLPPLSFVFAPGTPELPILSAGVHLHYLLVDLQLKDPLPEDTWISYRLSLQLDDDPEKTWQDHTVWAPDLCYPENDLPRFKVPTRVDALLHGSCRKPHSQERDGLTAADRHLAKCLSGDVDHESDKHVWPSLLVLSGDQVYVDDVAGPMLQSISLLVERLGLPDEALEGVEQGFPASGNALGKAGGLLYKRETLLPKIDQNASVFDVLFGGTSKPVFTSQHARNHLITLAEMLAMYLLVWSPAAWSSLPDPSVPDGLTEKDAKMYAQETGAIRQFREDLPACRRVLAHLPTAMMFDDHDVTDDWNLSLAWEEAAYGHPLSRRVIGNALVAYGINQGWGNRPEILAEGLSAPLRGSLEAPGSAKHDAAIGEFLSFEHWDFEWPTSPPLIVLDTRTRRWRSERNTHYPSGLLDWEAVTDLQGHLRGKSSVLLVSAAPIFGVKLIEAVQRLFTVLGKPLMVDAEYWMAHPGTASAILNVFRHRSTPEHFVILSGDVHYSFVYDVELRRHRDGAGSDPKIWQICSSGIKNTWPEKLISALDHGNRWAFSPRSPLNWFTKRRGMRVIPRKPVGTPHGRRILNASGIGLVMLDESGAPTDIRQLAASGEVVPFERRELEARLD